MEIATLLMSPSTSLSGGQFTETKCDKINDPEGPEHKTQLRYPDMK